MYIFVTLVSFYNKYDGNTYKMTKIIGNNPKSINQK